MPVRLHGGRICSFPRMYRASADNIRNAATNTSNTAQVPLTNGISSGSGSGNNHAHHHPNANTNRTTSNINSGPSSMSRHSQGYLYPFPGLGRVSNSSLQRRFNLTRQSSGPSNPTTTAQANSTPYSQAYLSSRHTSTTNHVAPFARAAGPGTDNRDTSEPLVHDEEGDVEMTEEGDVEMMDV